MKQIKSSLKVLVPLSIGLFFIYLTINATTVEERKLIANYIKNADYRFVLLSIVFGVLSHLSRAYRWQFLLAPMGYKPRFINSTLAVLIAYIANLGIPRSGEILRATTLSSYEKNPFRKNFGTIIAERLVDLVLLIGFIFIALSLQYALIWEVLREKKIAPATILFGFTFLLIVALGLRLLFKKNQSALVLKIKSFLKGLVEGILSIRSMPNKGAFLIHTVFIWLMYLAMFMSSNGRYPKPVRLDLIPYYPPL